MFAHINKFGVQKVSNSAQTEKKLRRDRREIINYRYKRDKFLFYSIFQKLNVPKKKNCFANWKTVFQIECNKLILPVVAVCRLEFCVFHKFVTQNRNKRRASQSTKVLISFIDVSLGTLFALPNLQLP